MTTANKSVKAFNLSFMFDLKPLLEEGMIQLMDWVREGSLRVPKVTTYQLCDVSRAHRDLESGNTVGKLVLTMDGNRDTSDKHTKQE